MEPIEAVEQLRYPAVVDEVILKMGKGLTLEGKYRLELRRPREIVVNSFAEIRDQYEEHEKSLSAVPKLGEIVRLNRSHQISFDGLLNLPQENVIERALGWFDPDLDIIVMIIDRIEECSINLAQKLRVDFDEGFFGRFLRYCYAHELVHSTLDHDFKERLVFRHLTESYANWVASKFLPQDILSNLIVGMHVYEQPEIYGYNFLLDAMDKDSKVRLFNLRVNHRHKDAVEFFYRNLIGYDFYDTDEGELLIVHNDIERLSGQRSLYCVALGRIDFITNVDGFVIAVDVGSIFGLVPPHSYIVSNRIGSWDLLKEASLHNCFEIPIEELDLKKILLSNRITRRDLKRCHNRLFAQSQREPLDSDKIASILRDVLTNEGEPNIVQQMRSVFHGDLERLQCHDCGNVIDFPYKEGNVIVTEKCSFWADLGKDRVLIPEGSRVEGCPHINVMKEIIIKCECGSTIFHGTNIGKENE